MSSQVSERRFLSKKAVANRNGVHTGTIDRWVRQNRFPRPIKVSAKGTCRWPEVVITAWEQSQVDEIQQGSPSISERSAP
jgi:prophage regulatory protein